jgi:hypothetical protein
MTAGLLGRDQQSRALDWLWHLEEQREIGSLFGHLLVAERT